MCEPMKGLRVGAGKKLGLTVRGSQDYGVCMGAHSDEMRVHVHDFLPSGLFCLKGTSHQQLSHLLTLSPCKSTAGPDEAPRGARRSGADFGGSAGLAGPRLRCISRVLFPEFDVLHGVHAARFFGRLEGAEPAHAADVMVMMR